MRRQVVWILALLVLAPALGAREGPDDKDKKGSPQSPADQYKAIVKEFSDARAEFSKHYRDAKTDEQRQKVYQERYPQPAKYTGKMLKIAEENRKDPGAFDALHWIIQTGRGSPETGKAVELIVRDHAANPKLGQLCQMLAYGGPEGTKGLRTILEKISNKDVQGPAAYWLGYALKREVGGDAPGDNAPALVKEAEQLFERVIKDFGDVKADRGTLGEQAQAQLKGLKNLLTIVVGKEAPEIEGADIEGVKFKLSEYRGKVVVLDFWGHW